MAKNCRRLRTLGGSVLLLALFAAPVAAQEGAPAVPEAPAPAEQPVPAAEPAAEPLQAPPPSGPVFEGWWLRINPTNVADHLYWRFGAAANRLSAPISWVKGQGEERIQFPASERMLPAVHLAALGMPPRQPVSFCVFYGEKGVALVEFTQEKNLVLDQTMTAPECMP